MNWLKFVFAGTLVSALSLSGLQADAGILSLLQDGSNFLEDDDFENLALDANGDGLVSVGDRFFGVFRIQAINGTSTAGPGDETITAVFGVEAISVTGAAGSATAIEFAPLQSGGADAAIAEWATVTAALGVTTPLPTNDSTAAIIYKHPDYTLADEAAASIGASVDTFDDTAGAVKLLELGDGGGVFKWETTGVAGVDDPANVITPGFASTNVIDLDVLVDVPDLIEWGPWFGVGNFVPPTQQDPGIWALATDTDFNADAKIVPEPGSVSIFCVLIGATCAGAYRRRRRMNASK